MAFVNVLWQVHRRLPREGHRCPHRKGHRRPPRDGTTLPRLATVHFVNTLKVLSDRVAAVEFAENSFKFIEVSNVFKKASRKFNC